MNLLVAEGKKLVELKGLQEPLRPATKLSHPLHAVQKLKVSWSVL